MVPCTPPYKAPISGPAVWKASDFSSPSDYWYYLSSETIAELDRALRRIRESGNPSVSAGAFGVEDFPLPSFENDAEALREELRFGSGFVVMKGLPIDRYSEREASMIYWGLGAHLGRAIPQTVKGDLLYSVRDEGYDLKRDYAQILASFMEGALVECGFVMPADEDAKVFDLFSALPAPDRTQERAVVHDLAGTASEVDEKIELLRRKANFVVTDGNLVRGGVDAEVADLDHRVEFIVGGDAAEVGAHARQQFVHAEGLGDIVVGAGVEGFNFLPLLVAHRQNNNWNLRDGANAATELDAVD